MDRKRADCRFDGSEYAAFSARGFPLFDKIRSAYIISVVMSKWYYSSLKRTLGGSMHHSDGTPVMSG